LLHHRPLSITIISFLHKLRRGGDFKARGVGGTFPSDIIRLSTISVQSQNKARLDTKRFIYSDNLASVGDGLSVVAADVVVDVVVVHSNDWLRLDYSNCIHANLHKPSIWLCC